MKRIYIATIVAFALSWTAYGHAVQISVPNGKTVSGDSSVGRAFKDRKTNVQVEDKGAVIRLLADDVSGDRHQRFVVRLASDQTVLIAHNIDIAPRVAGLQKGDSVRFYGEYVWNEQGGIVHWTHHDPNGHHTAGWLQYNGRIYQ